MEIKAINTRPIKSTILFENHKKNKENWLKKAISRTNEFINDYPKSERKKIGQFFTGEKTAKYMASLLSIPKQDSLVILDPGSGSGILSIALLELIETKPWVNCVKLICFETDENVIPILRDNLEMVKENCSFLLEYCIKTENYITSQAAAFEHTLLVESNLTEEKFDLIIENPPYKKISKASLEAQLVPSICKGAPNLYFIFVALSLFNLKAGGEMAVIIPRSWTSGLYFKNFRNYLFHNGSLERLHLFTSRNKVFDKETVLQETLILKIKKRKQIDSIEVTTSENSISFDNCSSFLAPKQVIVSGPDNYVYLVTNKKDLEVLEKLNKWKNTLVDLGLKMKTGLTVDFRSRSSLRNSKEEGTIPLFYSQHMKNGRINFPCGKEGEWLKTDKKGLHQPNENYLFVKRFTAKEEKKRLQCSIYLATDCPNYLTISTHNKINFIAGKSPLDVNTVYGLYVLFSSTIYDQYYRILNGSTQVNSTEINSMPVPSLDIIKQMGDALIKEEALSVEICDRIVERYI